jgi:hypothetical protein
MKEFGGGGIIQIKKPMIGITKLKKEKGGWTAFVQPAGVQFRQHE